MTDETFERVARTYGDMLYRVAYHALKNRADAEDVAQTVLLKLYQQGDRFESEEHRKHWLLRVAVNESRRLLRSFWRSRAVPLDEQWDAPVSDDPAKRELFQPDHLSVLLRGLLRQGGRRGPSCQSVHGADLAPAGQGAAAEGAVRRRGGKGLCLNPINTVNSARSCMYPRKN